MAIEQNAVQPSNQTSIEQAYQITSLMNESEVGIAVFDPQYRLLSSNPAYRDIRRLSSERARPGMPFETVIGTTLLIDGCRSDEIAAVIETDIKRLEMLKSDRFESESAAGDYVYIERFFKPSGLLVETVTQRSPGMTVSKEGMQARKKTLQVGRHRLKLALENLPDGFAIFDPDGTLVAVNQRYRDLAPHVAEHLYVGEKHEDIIRAVYRSGEVELGTQTEDEFVEFASRELKNPKDPTLDQLTDGRWIRFAAESLEDGSTVFILSDVTDFKTQEMRVVEANKLVMDGAEQLNIAIENMFAGLIMFDSQNRMVRCNKLYRKIFGFPDEVLQPGVTRNELKEKAIELGIFAADYDEVSAAGYNNSIGSKTPSLNHYKLGDGRIIQVRHAPIGDQGSLVLFMDITAEREMQAQLKLNNMKLENSNSELQNFAYVASHDLQEPLRKIEAFSDRLTTKFNDDLTDDGKLYLDRIQNAASRMRQLINDLLSFSRVTSNAKSFQKVDLNQVVASVVDDIQMRLEETKAIVNFENLPTVDADEIQMRQLFQNLISNSLKFRKVDVAPVVTITTQTTNRIGHDGRDAEFLKLQLSDNGIGFDNRFKDQIFAIFQRLHGRMEYEGTGIGLATCRKIVDRHNGTIDADGVENIGATFSIELPVVNAASEV